MDGQKLAEKMIGFLGKAKDGNGLEYRMNLVAAMLAEKAYYAIGKQLNFMPGYKA